MNKGAVCKTCEGFGTIVDPMPHETCPDCNGTGRIQPLGDDGSRMTEDEVDNTYSLLLSGIEWIRPNYPASADKLKALIQRLASHYSQPQSPASTASGESHSVEQTWHSADAVREAIIDEFHHRDWYGATERDVKFADAVIARLKSDK